MDITMIMVMSLDGIVANGTKHVSDWTSKEDQQHLQGLMKGFDAVIVGRKSFYMDNRLPCDYYVFTHNEDLLRQGSTKDVTYVNGTAADLAALLNERGYAKAALLGGPQTNHLFLKAKLVRDMYITIENKFFGTGTFLNGNHNLDCTFVLDSVRRLNEQGTLLLHYYFKN